MNFGKVSFLVAIVFSGALSLSTADNRCGWKLNPQELELFGPTGLLQKEFPIFEKTEKELVKSRITGEMTEIIAGNISRAVVSADGCYAAQITQTSRNYGYEHVEATTTLRYLNQKGDIVWEKRALDLYRHIQVSSDGHAVSFVLTTRDGCGSSNDCLSTAIVLDEQGNELIKFGPTYGNADIEMSSNGRYGMATNVGEQVIFFDLQTMKTVMKDWKSFKGLPRLLDNGMVEIVQRRYEGVPPNRKLVHENVVSRFGIK
jgi:hypothetical protein